MTQVELLDDISRRLHRLEEQQNQQWQRVGATGDSEAVSGPGSAIALLKRVRTLLTNGVPVTSLPSVAISGTPSVSISGTPSVSLSGTPTVNVLPTAPPSTYMALSESGMSTGRNHLTLFNPANSGLVAKVYRVWLHVATGTTLSRHYLQTVSTITASGGAAVTAQSLDTDNPSHGMTLYARASAVTLTRNVCVGNVDATIISTPVTLWEAMAGLQPLTLRPGQGVNVVQDTTLVLGNLTTGILFTVE